MQVRADVHTNEYLNFYAFFLRMDLSLEGITVLELFVLRLWRYFLITFQKFYSIKLPLVVYESTYLRALAKISIFNFCFFNRLNKYSPCCFN